MASASVNDGGRAARKSIIKTALILSALTALEFIIAGFWRDVAEITGLQEDLVRVLKNALFGILTIFKAFYIVAEFMHLGHEVKKLAWTILIPFIFIVWLIIGLVWEGTYWGEQNSNEMSYHSVVLEVDPAEEIKV